MISLEDGVLLRPKVAVRGAETDPAGLRRHDPGGPLQSQRRLQRRCLVRPHRYLGRPGLFRRGRLRRSLRAAVTAGDAGRIPDRPWQRADPAAGGDRRTNRHHCRPDSCGAAAFSTGAGRCCCCSCGDLIGDLIYYAIGRTRRRRRWPALAGALGVRARADPRVAARPHAQRRQDAVHRQMDAFHRLPGADRQRHAAGAAAALPRCQPARHPAEERACCSASAISPAHLAFARQHHAR